MRPPAEEALPLAFGDYRLEERLGHGGMAEVFRATHMAGMLERTVCIKRVLPEHADEASFVAMLIDEAKIAAQLKHDHIVEVLDLGEVDGVFFLAMELVDGCSLKAILARGPLDVRTAVTVGADLALALDYAHRAESNGRCLDIVHRDVTPDNIMVSCAGTLKLSDFGIAKAHERITRTRTGFTKGKLPYMAPEQADGSPIDHRVDQFATGILLWEALAGRRLFKRPTELETMQALFKDPIPRLADVARVPLPLDLVVMRALQRDRAKRFASMRELADALVPIQTQAGGRADLGALVARTLSAQTEVTRANDDTLQETPSHAPVSVAGAPRLEDAPTAISAAASVATRTTPSASQETVRAKPRPPSHTARLSPVAASEALPGHAVIEGDEPLPLARMIAAFLLAGAIAAALVSWLVRP